MTLVGVVSMMHAMPKCHQNGSNGTPLGLSRHGMALARAVLGLAALKPEGVHGYGILRDLRALLGGDARVTHGRVYGTLETLERWGALQMERRAHGRRPARKVYTITPAGRSLLSRLAEEPVAAAAAPFADDPLLRLLCLDPADAAEIDRLLAAYEGVCLQRLSLAAHVRRLFESSDLSRPLAEIIVAAIQARVRTELAWLEQLRELREDAA